MFKFLTDVSIKFSNYKNINKKQYPSLGHADKLSTKFLWHKIRALIRKLKVTTPALESSQLNFEIDEATSDSYKVE